MDSFLSSSLTKSFSAFVRDYAHEAFQHPTVERNVYRDGCYFCAGRSSSSRAEVKFNSTADGQICLPHLTFSVLSNSRPCRADHDDYLRSWRPGNTGTGRQKRVQNGDERKIGAIYLRLVQRPFHFYKRSAGGLACGV